LIPSEVVCSISEPINPFVEAESPLFLRSFKIIHSRCDLLHFQAFIHIIKIHDFNPPMDLSDDEGHLPSADSSDNDGYPCYDSGRGSLPPWPGVSRFAHDRGPVGETWPSLPTTGGGVCSASATMLHPMMVKAAWGHHPMVDLGRRPMCHPKASCHSMEAATSDVTRWNVGE
jgi:hypothetical protein